MNASPEDLTRDNLALWDHIFRQKKWGRYPSEELVRAIMRRFGAVDVRPGVRVLELGCGPGANLVFLVAEGFSVGGLDGSETAVAQAGQRLAPLSGTHDGQTIDLRVGDFSVNPWESGTFDAVVDIESTSANVLSVITAAVSEAHRVLKPRGLYFAKMFGTQTTGYGSGYQPEPNTSAPPAFGPCTSVGIIHFFEEAELRDLFSGFSSLTLDQSIRTVGGGRETVFEWIVQAEK